LRGHYHLLASGDRVALVEAEVTEHQIGMTAPEQGYGYIVTWTAGAPAPVISRRPESTNVFAMAGDVFLAASSEDGQLVALDLATLSHL
jgi:hypothetical protein